MTTRTLSAAELRKLLAELKAAPQTSETKAAITKVMRQLANTMRRPAAGPMNPRSGT